MLTALWSPCCPVLCTVEDALIVVAVPPCSRVHGSAMHTCHFLRHNMPRNSSKTHPVQKRTKSRQNHHNKQAINQQWQWQTIARVDKTKRHQEVSNQRSALTVGGSAMFGSTVPGANRRHCGLIGLAHSFPKLLAGRDITSRHISHHVTHCANFRGSCRFGRKKDKLFWGS